MCNVICCNPSTYYNPRDWRTEHTGGGGGSSCVDPTEERHLTQNGLHQDGHCFSPDSCLSAAGNLLL